jgi:Fic family protein
MKYVFILTLSLILVYSIIRRIRKGQSTNDLDDPLNPEQIKKRRENLDKIMKLAETQTRIMNKDVERFLNVSDATATRYLSYLTDLGKLIRVGERGQDVYYQLPPK